jgi:diaminopimelate decarboxylase
LESADEWQHFHHELRRSLSGVREPITWNNDGLGLSYINGIFHGGLQVYPYFSKRSKWLMLKDLLNSPLKSGERVADAINRRCLQLRIEPGRAALDQSGISIASVVHRSHDSAGELCVGLDMNFTQLRSSSAEFLVDPVLVPATRKGASVECYIHGSYCMDRDLILKRKIFLPHTPAPGDVMCFLNTAGYMMHFLESPGHGFGLAANLVFDARTEDLTFEPRGEP